jgi:hypothetical protein
METLDVEQKHWNKDLLYLFNKEEILGPDKRLYSEHSEDAIIKYIFSQIKPLNTWCVDIGAYGIRSSNTYRLIQDGWKSIQIEADRDLFLEMEKVYKDNLHVIILNEFITPGRLKGSCEPNCLDNILLKYEVPKDFDFLSIDVDSYEYEIWMNLESFSPNLICLECNQFETDFSVIDYDPSFDKVGKASLYKYKNKRVGYGGATVGLLNKLAEEKGYTYLCMDVSNAFYIKNSFL